MAKKGDSKTLVCNVQYQCEREDSLTFGVSIVGGRRIGAVRLNPKVSCWSTQTVFDGFFDEPKWPTMEKAAMALIRRFVISASNRTSLR